MLKTKISCHLNNLHLPLSVKDLIPTHLVPFVAMEMIEWSKYFCVRFNVLPSYCINFIQSSFFSCKGELDKARAAKELVQYKKLPVMLRTVIALDCWLVEDFRLLWRDCTEYERDCVRIGEFFTNFEFSLPYYYGIEKWKRILKLANKEEIEGSNKLLEDICLHSVEYDKDVSFKNSWNMLKGSKTEEFLIDSVERILKGLEFTTMVKNVVHLRSFVSMLRFLLNDDNTEEVGEKIIQHLTYFPLLYSLLIWPNQDLFMKMINLLLHELPEFDFYCLLHSIIDIIDLDYFCKTYNYRHLLRELWTSVYSHHRSFVFNSWESCSSQNIIEEYKRKATYDFLYDGIFKDFKSCDPRNYFLYQLFSIQPFTEQDGLNVKIIVQDIEANDKRMIVLQQGDEICSAALISGRPRLADYFMECFVEKELVNEYKRNFLNRKLNYILDKLRLLGKQNIINDICVWSENNS